MRRLTIVLAGMLVIAAHAATAQEPKRGGTLNLIVQPEPPTLMLGVNKLGPVSFVGSKIYEGLVTLSPKLEPIPVLARSWTISPDHKTYTFKLRKGVKWHDGKPFSSADVLFSFKTFLPATFARTRMVMDRMESITAPDDETVVFRLKEPFPALMLIFEATGGTIVPRHVYEGSTDFLKHPANQTPVGTGPFKLKEWRKGAFIHLVRNPDYYQTGRPYVDDVYFHIIPDANGRSAAFETGKVDALRGGDVENFEMRRLAGLAGVSVTEAGWEFLDPIGFFHMNFRKKPMDDVRFRRAVAHAIDRKFIIDTIFAGYGKPVDGPLTSRSAFNDPKVLTRYAYDPAKARALLDEIGLKPDTSGTRIELRLLPLPYGETWQRLAEYIRERLNDVGIRTTIVATDVAGWFSRLSNGDFDMALNFVYLLGDPAIGVNQTYLSTNQLGRGSAANVDGYVNTAIDEMLERAARSPSRDERQKIYSRVQQQLSADVPILWTHEIVFPTLYRAKVKGLISTGLGMNENFTNVWVDR